MYAILGVSQLNKRRL